MYSRFHRLSYVFQTWPRQGKRKQGTGVTWLGCSLWWWMATGRWASGERKKFLPSPGLSSPLPHPNILSPPPFLAPASKTTPAAQRWFSLERERTRAHSTWAAPRRFVISPFVSSSLFVASTIVVNEREGEGGLSQGWAKEGKKGLSRRGNKERKKGLSPEKKERKISKRGWA